MVVYVCQQNIIHLYEKTIKRINYLMNVLMEALLIFFFPFFLFVSVTTSVWISDNIVLLSCTLSGNFLLSFVYYFSYSQIIPLRYKTVTNIKNIIGKGYAYVIFQNLKSFEGAIIMIEEIQNVDAICAS